MSGFPTEVDSSRSGTVQTLMRSQVGVVVKPELEPLFEVSFGQGLEGTQAQGIFERSPESLDDCDGAVATNSPETLPGAEPAKGFAKSLGDELLSLIGDEVSGRAVRWTPYTGPKSGTAKVEPAQLKTPS